MQPERHVFWRVRVINSQTRQFSDLDLVPDAATTSPEELAEIIRLADSRSLGDQLKLIKYRHRFKAGEMKLEGVHNFSTVFLPDYFEDETGRPLGRFGMMQTFTGKKDGLVLGDPESVWHIGPTPMANPSAWTADKADALDHFVEVADCLAKSDWLKAKCSVTMLASKDGGEPKIIRHQSPNVLLLNSVLAFVRQLMAKNDDLFNRAVTAYMEHSSDNGKKICVTQEQRWFTETLEKPPMTLGQKLTMTGRELLNLYFYPFGLLHVPKPSQVQEFRQAIQRHGHQWLNVGLHATMQQLVSHAHNVSIVVKQDLAGWVKVGHASPNRINITDVLGPHD